MNNLINWSELSRYITAGDRKCIRAEKIPPKHLEKLDQLFLIDLPEWWGKRKDEIKKSGA